MLRPVVADLHLHTVLSPCADYRMVPKLILGRAEEMGVELIAITDHNSGENALAVIEAAAGRVVTVLPGMEVESREGVHLLTLFDRQQQLQQWQETVYRALPPRENVERVLGTQLVVDADGNLRHKNPRRLITSVDLSMEEVILLSQELGGLCIPAHVDRPANGLLGVFGLLPQDLQAPALEISPGSTPEQLLGQYPGLEGKVLIRSSDAHNLNDIGRSTTTLLVEQPSVSEVRLAFRGEEGRLVLSLGQPWG